MKILDLTNSEKSDIKYKPSNFPDGQNTITLLNPKSMWYTQRIGVYDHEGKPGTLHIEICDKIKIKSRLNNWTDLEKICCAVADLRENGIEEIHLYIPYFLGARSDRKFDDGGNSYLKNVICPIINALNLNSVTVLDPHSYVLEACLNNFRKEDNTQLVEFAIDVLYKTTNDVEVYEDFILISPDAGASHKIYKLAEKIGYKGDIITCSKERDNNGNLTKCVVPDNDGIVVTKDSIIIDDIFDYGTTFINILDALNSKGYDGKKYLIVTHAIQDKGIERALLYFDGIFTTNSYKERESTHDLHIMNVF
jgi:ribose-phosphate pyrophosphokinase